MGRVYKMSWEAGRKRWAKMFKGRRFLVTCEELGAPPTAEGSYHAANQWWETKLGELLRPQQQEQELLNRYPKTELLEKIKAGEAAKQLLQGLGEYPLFPQQSPEEMPVVVKGDGSLNLPGSSQLVGDIGKPVHLDRTLAHHVERFLQIEQARGKAPLTYADIRYFIHKAMSCPALPSSLDIAEINASTLTTFYAWLRNDSDMTPKSQQKCFQYFRRMVRFLWSEELIQLPKNLDSRQFTFDGVVKQVKTYPLALVREMLATLPDRLRLYALLSLNVGMLGVDMATLRHEELKDDRITRKRTKTRNHKNVPVVCYQLWPETLALLNTYPRTHSEFVLASKAGTPLWRTELRDGKNIRVDLVSVQWRRGRGEKRASKPPITLKALRSVSATLLENHAVQLPSGEKVNPYASCVALFLGHAPATIKDRHYAAPPQELFDDALRWLRGQFFPA